MLLEFSLYFQLFNYENGTYVIEHSNSLRIINQTANCIYNS